MSVKKLLSLFIALFIVFGVLLTPISFIAKYIDTPKNVAYQSLSGTLWSGRANVIQVDKWHFSSLTWDMNIASLFTGKLSFDLKFGQARESNQLSGKGNISLGFNTLSLSELTFRAPANAIRSELPIPTSELKGRVILDIDDFHMTSAIDPNTPMQMCDILQGELLWTKAEVVFGQAMELGTIASQLSCNEGDIVALFDGLNRLGLEGSARIESPDSFTFQGFVKPDPSLPRDIHNGIKMFSQLDAQGRYPIKL